MSIGEERGMEGGRVGDEDGWVEGGSEWNSVKVANKGRV